MSAMMIKERLAEIFQASAVSGVIGAWYRGESPDLTVGELEAMLSAYERAAALFKDEIAQRASQGEILKSNAVKMAVGRVIDAAAIDDNQLVLRFLDGSKLAVWDDGQSCCEVRWMATDDDLGSLIGFKLKEIRLKDGPTVQGEDDEADTQFLEVITFGGDSVVLSNYNEHNGYYGGFDVQAKFVVEGV